MVVIRLARHGAKKRPFYHIVAADSRAPRDGRFLEKLGFFNPMTRESELRCNINWDRYSYWAGVGAQSSDRVKSIIREQNKKIPLTHAS